MRVLFAGSGVFGLPTLRALAAAGFDVPLVISQPDKPAGRGKKLTPTPIAQFAIERGLPLLRTSNINTETLPQADVMIVIAFGQKIAPHVVNHATHGAVNLHASILPRHRGAAPIHWAILSGDELTANSAIRLAEKMDAGAVLGTSDPIEIANHTTAELHDRLADDGPGLILRVIEQLRAGTAVERVQDEAKVTLAPKLSRQSAMIDFGRSAFEIARQINAMYAWPGCRVELFDGSQVTARLTLARAEPIDGSRGVGEIDREGAIGCGSGRVRIIEVQPEGGRLMSVSDFRNGRAWDAGMRVRSIA